MTVFLPRTAVLTGVLAVAAALALSACGSSSDGSDAAGGKSAATATTAEALGGVDALAEAAKKEGTLRAVALPRDWANYGALMDGFKKKYGIKVEVENPNGASQDEISAVTSRKGKDSAPDVLDLGSSFAQSAAQQGLLAPYMVTGFADIPDTQRDSIGRWANDYGGYISFGCDAKRVRTCPTSFKDLLKPEYKGLVALNGSPTKSGSAFGAVYAAALANGGSFDDIQPGIDFFAKLKKSGNYTPSTPPRPPSGRVGHRSASTGTTSTRGTPTSSSPRASTGRSWSPRTASSPSTTRRPSTRTRRTPRPRACGRSTSTAPRARTSDSRDTPARL